MPVTTAPTLTLINTIELGDDQTLLATATIPTGRVFNSYDEVVAYATATYGADIALYLLGADDAGNLELEESTTCVAAEYSEDQVESFADDLPSFGLDLTWVISHIECGETLATATVH